MTPPNTPRTLAAIDLGTNTALMLTGRRIGRQIDILDDAYVIVRMGQGVDAHRRIGPEAIERVCLALQTYRRQATALGVDALGVFGTSALRDAANKDAVIAQVKQRVGLDLQALSGATEARLTFRGAGYGLDLPDVYAVLDIGGGSTEWAQGDTHRVTVAHSMDIGSVRLTERFFPHLPPRPDQIGAATDCIHHALARLPARSQAVPVVGVAGTVTTLGAIDMGLVDFNAEALNGHFLDRARIEALSAGLLSASFQEIAAQPQIPIQRADIIPAGALILRTVVAHLDLPGVVVSTRGIRYGLLEMMFASAQYGQ